jgi:membrane protein DedA with SNARE-associated domain
MTVPIASFADSLLANFGYLAVFAVVAIESLGIPAPGETVLVAAGIYAGATHNLDITGVLAASVAGAVIGDNIGCMIGRRGGYRLLLRHGHRVHVHERHLKVARYVFDRHGGKVVFFGRFVSILRTYAAFLAGVSQMDFRRFFLFNLAGGLVWSLVFGLAAYYGQHAFERASTPVNVSVGAAALVGVLGATLYVRRRAEALTEVAEQAYPGPLT